MTVTHDENTDETKHSNINGNLKPNSNHSPNPNTNVMLMLTKH